MMKNKKYSFFNFFLLFSFFCVYNVYKGVDDMNKKTAHFNYATYRFLDTFHIYSHSKDTLITSVPTKYNGECLFLMKGDRATITVEDNGTTHVLPVRFYDFVVKQIRGKSQVLAVFKITKVIKEDERRRDKRRMLFIDGFLTSKSNTREIRVLDDSHGGIRIECNNQIHDDELQTIEVSYMIDGMETKAFGEIKWGKKVGSTYQYGLQFVDALSVVVG